MRDPISSWHQSEHCGRDTEECIAEIEREIGVRLRCYDRWMGEGKLSYTDARDRMERLMSAAQHLRVAQCSAQKVADLAEASQDIPASFRALHDAADQAPDANMA